MICSIKTATIYKYGWLIRVRGPPPNGLLLPWPLVLGPGTAKLFISFFFFFSFWVGSVLRNRNSLEKAPAAMSHS